MSLQEVRYTGTLTSTGSTQWIDLPCDIDEFILYNKTNLAAGSGIIETRWNNTMADATAQTLTLSGGTITNAIITSGGFTYQDASESLGSANAITAVTAANPAVASATTTPQVGDIVRVYNTTAMLQIAGLDLSVTAVSAGSTLTFGYLDASGFAAAATAGYYRKLPFDLSSYPRKRYITKITQASSAVITLSVTHGYSVGEKVTIYNRSDRGAYRFGMSQIDGQTGTITAVSTTNNTITVDIDSSSYDAFAYPTSAVASAGVTFPHIVPAGESGTVVSGAFDNPTVRRILLGSNIDGTSGDEFTYVAIRNAS